ncbi:MAG TPA: DNA primase, partial [Eubacteriaceae bacterium]|nr:DNA primase [Eubacteriaceae bacterium]
MRKGFSQEQIDEVIGANNIIDLISEYVTLKKAGSSYKGKCPFHHEKTPSFVVSADKQLYHCFGCGVGGNTVNFIMDIEHLNFVEAIRFLAKRANISLQESDEISDENQRKKDRQFQLHKDAANFFYKTLYQDLQAQKYLFARGIDKNTIKQFAMGYAPNTGDALYRYLSKKQYHIEEILASGLVMKSQKRSG